jgi:hypothetical protein
MMKKLPIVFISCGVLAMVCYVISEGTGWVGRVEDMALLAAIVTFSVWLLFYWLSQ